MPIYINWCDLLGRDRLNIANIFNIVSLIARIMGNKTRWHMKGKELVIGPGNANQNSKTGPCQVVPKQPLQPRRWRPAW